MATSKLAEKFSLDLMHGPYRHAYTRNGRFLLLGGLKGHVSLIDQIDFKLRTELFLGETVRDVCTLFDESMFAVAQKKRVFVYDSQGIEIHCLKDHAIVNRLNFLPYHFLLASIGKFGFLKYIDISTGENVSSVYTGMGPCRVMATNPWNAIIHLGHQNGTVTLWSPNTKEPLIKILCHKMPVTSIDIDLSGKYMITSGGDQALKVWDIRNYKPIFQLKQRISKHETVALSQKNVLAVADSSRINVWRDVFTRGVEDDFASCYFPGRKTSYAAFCPFEDALGVSTENGFYSLVVPGSGEPNFDSFEVNPFESKKERQNRLVKSLLDKIQPEFITLNPTDIGSVKAIQKDKVWAPNKKKDITKTVSNENKKAKENDNEKINKKKRKTKKMSSVEYDKRIRQKTAERISGKTERAAQKYQNQSDSDVESDKFDQLVDKILTCQFQKHQ